jgi:hypothetical protein
MLNMSLGWHAFPQQPTLSKSQNVVAMLVARGWSDITLDVPSQQNYKAKNSRRFALHQNGTGSCPLHCSMPSTSGVAQAAAG